MELGLVRLVNEALLVPVWEYAALFAIILVAFLYHVLDFHFVGDLITGLRGDKVEVIFSPLSKLAPELVESCGVLNRRYRPTVWLCSPHLQTAFVHFHGRAPKVQYKRTLYVASDGGTVALDWQEPEAGTFGAQKLEETPIVLVVPGLSSDSSNAYLKHLAHGIAAKGWRAVIANHRGLGGVSLTSDCFYNAGWTNDVRGIISEVHNQYPAALLFAVGTSLGANILVKYLGEEGANTVLSGAISICCPWDLVVCDRFISRRPLQKLYDKALAVGLTDYVLKHEKTLSTLSNWNFIKKSRSVRAFDNFFTRLVGKFETVDEYYRRSSCVYVLNNVAVPLLCVNSLDDPLCTKEAIPWDECRINPNVILAVTQHGGHLAYYEGLTAKRVWWVRAVTEFVSAVLSSSSLEKVIHPENEEPSTSERRIVEEENECSASTQEVAVEEDLVANGTPPDEEYRKEATGEKGLTLHLCMKNRSEVLALQRSLSQMLEEAPAREETLSSARQETAGPATSFLPSKKTLLWIAVPVLATAVAFSVRKKFNRKRFF